MSESQDPRIEKIIEVLKEKIKNDSCAEELSKQLIQGAEKGLEIDGSFDDWFEKRFKYQLVWLDKDDYLTALINALWLAPVFAGTDFGSSRQRDMAQVWTDTARGFLGEIAVSKFFKDKFSVSVKRETRRGELEEFLSSDISEVMFPNENWRKLTLKISIKTTKFNGRWLDAPGAQGEHSDVFILVKLGILRHHFLAFLKALSFLKDKLFPPAKEMKLLSGKQEKELWDEIPEFDPIPAYISGYLYKKELTLPIHSIVATLKGRKNKRICITHGVGLFSPENLKNHQKILELNPNNNDYEIEIDPIIDALTGPHFLAHSGSLKHGYNNWMHLIKIMRGINEGQ